MSAPPRRSPWAWVPSLYFLQGAPYVVANNVSVALYKTLGVGNAEIAFLTSWVSLVWALKALWSPFVDGVGTKRRWTVATQVAMAPALLLVAAALPLPAAVPVTIGLFFVVAFLSATHDIAADGLYMLGLSTDQQAAFVGVRSTFWRLALISGEGGLVVLAGVLGRSLGPVLGWQATLSVAAGVFALGALFHAWALPWPDDDRPRPPELAAGAGWDAVRSFVGKADLIRGLAFIIFYRFAENHLSKLIVPFLLDERAKGGLGLTLEQVGFAKGTVAVACLVVGGLLGGWMISRFGLKAMLPSMVLALNVPDLVYVYLSMAQPSNFNVVVALMGLEAFGYGFGFTAYMMFLIHLADGPYKTAHYAMATGLMALSVFLAQFWSGWMQAQLGYVGFFWWVMVLTLPGAAVAAWVRLPEGFGRRAA